MGLTKESFDAALKEHYTDDTVQNLVYTDRPFLGLVSKMEKFGGTDLPIPLIYANPQNRSQDFATAIAGVSTTGVKAFKLTRVHDYSVVKIDNETMEASVGDANAFMEARTTEIDGAINALSNSLAQKLYRSGWGVVGNIALATSVVGTTLTLSDPNDVVNFEVGQVIQFSDTEGSSVLRDGGDSVTVTGVDRSSGILTVTPALSGVAGLQPGDFIFFKGDRDNAASPVRLCVSGLAAWCPITTPSAALFFGVDRTVDSSRLGGLRLDASTMPIEEALISAVSLVSREGGKPDHCFLSYAQFSQLEKALGAKVQYINVKMTADIGFAGIQVNGGKGTVKIIPDQNCPDTSMFILQLNTWKLYSLGKAVKCLNSDGLTMLRQANADGVEVRYGYYANLGCSAPGYNIHVKLAAPPSF